MMHKKYVTPAGFWEGEQNPWFPVIVCVLHVLFVINMSMKWLRIL